MLNCQTHSKYHLCWKESFRIGQSYREVKTIHKRRMRSIVCVNMGSHVYAIIYLVYYYFATTMGTTKANDSKKKEKKGIDDCDK